MADKTIKEQEREIQCREEYEKWLSKTIEKAEVASDSVKTAYSTAATAYAIGADVVAVYNTIANSINQEKPFRKKYIIKSMSNSKKNLNFIYAIIVFFFTSTFLLFIPTNNKYELRETVDKSQTLLEQDK